MLDILCIPAKLLIAPIVWGNISRAHDNIIVFIHTELTRIGISIPVSACWLVFTVFFFVYTTNGFGSRPSKNRHDYMTPQPTSRHLYLISNLYAARWWAYLYSSKRTCIKCK